MMQRKDVFLTQSQPGGSQNQSFFWCVFHFRLSRRLHHSPEKTVKTLRWKLRYFNCWPYELVRHNFVQWVYVFICMYSCLFHVPWTKHPGCFFVAQPREPNGWVAKVNCKRAPWNLCQNSDTHLGWNWFPQVFTSCPTKKKTFPNPTNWGKWGNF